MNVLSKQPVKHSPIRRNVSIGVFLAVIATGIIVLWIGVRDVLTISNAFAVLQESIQQVKSDATTYRYSNIDTELANAQKALDELDQIITTAPTFTSSFSPLKRNGDAFEVFLSQTRVLLNCAESLSKIGVPIAKIAFVKEGDSHIRTLTESEKKKILDILSEGLPSLSGVNASLKLVQQRLETINDANIPNSARPIRAELLAGADQLQQGIETLLPAVTLAPAFLGHDGESTYLILLQNNAETRATGGFIGTYGVLSLRDGEITKFFTDNVYNIDDQALSLNVAPPEPLQKYGNIKKWYLRDSNWSPDFEQAAQQAIWFYNHEGGHEKIDGVIALTPDVISSLMKIVGDISVDGLNFQADQFYDQLQYQVEKGYERRGVAKEERKDVVRLISDELLRRFSQLRIQEWSQIVGVLRGRLAEKSLLIYSTRPDLQEYVRTQGWGGEIIQTNDDYLMVVDSNIISLKTDSVMDKKILYTVTEQDDGSLKVSLELAYQNNGVYSWTSTTYRDYVRILIPLNSKIIASSEPLEISQEHGKMLLGHFLSIEPQKKGVLTVEYTLPDSIKERLKNGLYTIFVQKQSGISTQEFSLSTHFIHPIRSADPVALSGSISGDGKFDFTSLLETDKEIQLHF